MFYVYVLYNKEFNRFYVGMTNNLNRRISEHNSGKMKATKAFIPWIVVHYETFESRIEARSREKFLKSAALYIFTIS
jgi:putative endonuclease